MEKFFKRRLPSNEQSSLLRSSESSPQRQRIETNLEELPSDPGKRLKISSYHLDDQDKIRRIYLQRGPYQPTQHNFPQRKIGDSLRRFCPSWFNEFGNWLEYSIEKDVAFCLYCYLFKPNFGKKSGGDTFMTEGFTLWNKKQKLSSHVGGPNSAHNIAWKKSQDLNQETSLKRAADTHWGSHYSTLVNLILMYSAVCDVVKMVKEDGLIPEKRAEANCLLRLTVDFEFAFTLHLMKNILGISNELSQALQRKDQDIINAMNLVKITKLRLKTMRDDGWDSLLQEVILFCNVHDIDIPDMDDDFFPDGKLRRGGRGQAITIKHHYCIELFYTIVDMQLTELCDRFSETNTHLLLCMSSLSPINLFSSFDKAKLIEFAKFYPREFCSTDLVMLDNQLETYIIDMRSSVEFASLKGIGNLSEKLVESGRHVVYPLIYLLLKLAMILPVATATVERAFSGMKIVKNRLRNRMGDAWMNDCLVTYIEREVFNNVDNELIIQRFQNMKSRRDQL